MVVQFLYMLGVIGELWICVSQSSTSSIATYVAQHPSSTWLIGPAFAAVTGVAIKEGLCYGKPEAGLLALVRFHIESELTIVSVPPVSSHIIETLLLMLGLSFS